VFHRAVSLDPADTNAQFNLGLSLLEAGRPIEAIAILRSLADKPLPDSDVLSLLAESYESAGQTQKAIEVLRRAAGLYPQDPQHYQFLAALCVKHDSYDLASEVLDVGIAKVPNSADLQTMRGLLFMLTGRPEKAEAAFNEATRVAPDESWGRLGRAVALFSSGQYAESIRVLREQLARDPDDPQINYFLARVLLCQSEDPESPEFQEAKADLRKALVKAPNFTQALSLEAKIYLKLHRDADAIVDLERAISVDPRFGTAIYQLSRIYARTGRKAESARLFAKVDALLASERTHQRVHLARTEDGPLQ
jgi:predicted Zn-dependent protease